MRYTMIEKRITVTGEKHSQILASGVAPPGLGFILPMTPPSILRLRYPVPITMTPLTEGSSPVMHEPTIRVFRLRDRAERMKLLPNDSEYEAEYTYIYEEDPPDLEAMKAEARDDGFAEGVRASKKRIAENVMNLLTGDEKPLCSRCTYEVKGGD